MSGIGSSRNGSEQRRAMVDRALAAMPVPKATAAMTSQERSEQADQMRTQLVELTRAHNRLVELVEAHGKRADAHADVLVNHDTFVARSFWQRLRWLVTGR